MEELVEKLQVYLTKQNSISVERVMKELDLEEYQVYGLVKVLRNRGYLFDILDGKIVKVKPMRDKDVYEVPSNLEHLKLLLISDTHIGSKYDRMDILRYLYRKAEERGTNYVLHSGDLTEGFSGRPQQIYELRELSYTDQRDYVVKNYPKSKIPTYVIAGNHDQWWIRKCGSDIVKDICDRREDMHYLGSDCEDIKIGKLRVRMRHGSGGSAYAKSYRMQKYLDSIAPEERPHILQMGHTHQAFYMKQGDTHCFQVSCLQDLTPFERSMGFSNDKSCWWVDVNMDKKGNPIQVTQELESFGAKKLYKKR